MAMRLMPRSEVKDLESVLRKKLLPDLTADHTGQPRYSIVQKNTNKMKLNSYSTNVLGYVVYMLDIMCFAVR